MKLTEIEFRTMGKIRQNNPLDISQLSDDGADAVVGLQLAALVTVCNHWAALTKAGRKAHNDEMLKRTKGMGKPLFEVLR